MRVGGVGGGEEEEDEGGWRMKEGYIFLIFFDFMSKRVHFPCEISTVGITAGVEIRVFAQNV